MLDSKEEISKLNFILVFPNIILYIYVCMYVFICVCMYILLYIHIYNIIYTYTCCIISILRVNNIPSKPTFLDLDHYSSITVYFVSIKINPLLNSFFNHSFSDYHHSFSIHIKTILERIILTIKFRQYNLFKHKDKQGIYW